ncbi:MAG: ABC transporter permease subunit [Limnobacter sp.]|nr:ABC transporter permease subunit [Limnobacter sp.]
MDWSFLSDPAGFGLSEGWLSVSLTSSYWAVIFAGLLNTLKVALPALLLCTLLGLLVGLGRLSTEPVLRRLCDSYVGLIRNVPLLLQLLATYFLLVSALPVGSQAWSLGDVFFLSKSGLAFPAWSGSGWSVPVQGRFTVENGWVLTPEYLAVLLALVVYTSAFVAEIVRAGVSAVPKGLIQGGLALGLQPLQVRLTITLPVALRLIVPSLSNQYLNLLKNASLGVAVGYPELVSVSNTAMNQSGKALECVLIILLLYAALSAVASSLMNWLNRRVNRGAL